MSREDYDYEDEDYFEDDEEWFEEEDLDDLLENDEELKDEDILKKLVEADKDRKRLIEKIEEDTLNEELEKRGKKLEKSKENFFNPDDLVM